MKRFTTRELDMVYGGRFKLCIPLGKIHYLVYFKQPVGYVSSIGGTSYSIYDVCGQLVAVGTSCCGKESVLADSPTLHRYERRAMQIISDQTVTDDDCLYKISSLLKEYVFLEQQNWHLRKAIATRQKYLK